MSGGRGVLAGGQQNAPNCWARSSGTTSSHICMNGAEAERRCCLLWCHVTSWNSSFQADFSFFFLISWIYLCSSNSSRLNMAALCAFDLFFWGVVGRWTVIVLPLYATGVIYFKWRPYCPHTSKIQWIMHTTVRYKGASERSLCSMIVCI